MATEREARGAACRDEGDGEDGDEARPAVTEHPRATAKTERPVVAEPPAVAGQRWQRQPVVAGKSTTKDADAAAVAEQRREAREFGKEQRVASGTGAGAAAEGAARGCGGIVEEAARGCGATFAEEVVERATGYA
jgi:hypothetical protein